MDNIKKYSICVTGISEGERKVRKIFEEKDNGRQFFRGKIPHHRLKLRECETG